MNAEKNHSRLKVDKEIAGSTKTSQLHTMNQTARVYYTKAEQEESRHEQAKRLNLLIEELRPQFHPDVKINAAGDILFRAPKPPMQHFKGQLKLAVEDMQKVAEDRDRNEPELKYMFVRRIKPQFQNKSVRKPALLPVLLYDDCCALEHVYLYAFALTANEHAMVKEYKSRIAIARKSGGNVKAIYDEMRNDLRVNDKSSVKQSSPSEHCVREIENAILRLCHTEYRPLDVKGQRFQEIIKDMLRKRGILFEVPDEVTSSDLHFKEQWLKAVKSGYVIARRTSFPPRILEDDKSFGNLVHDMVRFWAVREFNAAIGGKYEKKDLEESVKKLHLREY